MTAIAALARDDMIMQSKYPGRDARRHHEQIQDPKFPWRRGFMAINPYHANVGPQERPKGEWFQNRIIRPSVDPGLQPGLACGALSGLWGKLGANSCIL